MRSAFIYEKYFGSFGNGFSAFFMTFVKKHSSLRNASEEGIQ